MSEDYIKTKRYRLYKGDCLDILPQIKEGTVQLILTDLPYGITANKWDSIIPLDTLFPEYWRVLKEGGVIALTASQPFTSILVTHQIKFFKHEWIWIKNKGSNFANTVREPFKEHESVLVFSKGKWKYNKQMQPRTGGGLDRVQYEFNKITSSSNYRKFDKVNKNHGELRVPSSWQKFNTETGLHPTQKPVGLMEYLIRTYTDEKDIVLDSCMGSGTTGVACINTKRRFIGIEQDDKYFSVASERIATTKPPLFGG